MAGLDFKLDASGDITLSSGKWILINNIQESVRQRLQVKYKTFRGEMFTNINYGIPYRTQNGVKGIIGKGYSQSDIDAIFIAETNAEPDVIRILNFSSVYSPFTRQYEVNVEVLTADGPIRVTSPMLSPNDEVTYPLPSELVIELDCAKKNVGNNATIVPNDAPLDLILLDNSYILV